MAPPATHPGRVRCDRAPWASVGGWGLELVRSVPVVLPDHWKVGYLNKPGADRLKHERQLPTVVSVEGIEPLIVGTVAADLEQGDGVHTSQDALILTAA